LEYRLQHPEKRQFTDIFYEDLKDRAAEVLTSIYQNDGGITPDLLATFKKVEQENPMRKYGIHDYKLEDFRMTNEDILIQTKNYREFIGNLKK
jgi:hypothetical protein